MKKLILLVSLALLLFGCGEESKENVLSDFSNKINSAKSYKLTGNMEISNDEETFTYSLESYYMKDDYYKVILVNQTNNHEQIILKNKEDIYVITPALNKSFKFQSEWPNNSSQAYLLDSINNDIKNDKNVVTEKVDKGYIIKSNVNYPNNEDLKYQKIYLDHDKNVEKVEVFNNDDIVKIEVTFDNIDLKANLSEKDFKLDDYIKSETKENEKDKINNDNNKTETSKCDENDIDCKKENIENNNINNKDDGNNENTTNENTTNENTNTNENNKNNTSKETTSIENIIYPLYIPSNTFLTNSETIETATGNRVILTFSGNKNFVLIEEVSTKNLEMEIIPVYGEPLMLTETVGVLSANSLSWDTNNISYYLASTELSASEMLTIANSLGNTTLVNSQK